MGALMLETTTKARNMGEESIHGKMAAFMMVIGFKIKYQDTDSISGQMAGDTKESGWITKCMVWASTLGEMAASMKVSTNSIKNMALGLIFGLTDGNMLESGWIVNDMAKAALFQQKDTKDKVFGSKISAFVG